MFSRLDGIENRKMFIRAIDDVIFNVLGISYFVEIFVPNQHKKCLNMSPA